MGLGPVLYHEVKGLLNVFREKGELPPSSHIRLIEKLPGDASTRQYFRVWTKTSESIIVMLMEPFFEKGLHTPFLSVQRHLHECGVRVPLILDMDPERGLILLEDLGDATLLRSLQKVGDGVTEREFFIKTIDLLLDLHLNAGPGRGSENLEGFHLKFDVEKLMWEVNFTFEHFYQKHLNRQFSERDAQVFNSSFESICKELDAEPVVFTHRDYHSRNVMLTHPERGFESEFVMIDFQDARMGLAQYDLASLLRDSYYQLGEAQIETLLKYYYNRMQEEGRDLGTYQHFERIFDLMSVQRNFKAIGSFASFLNRRGNPAYLKFIGNTFENIRRNLLKYPEYQELREILFHYYYF